LGRPISVVPVNFQSLGYFVNGVILLFWPGYG
jgi:hypothetical protein